MSSDDSRVFRLVTTTTDYTYPSVTALDTRVAAAVVVVASRTMVRRRVGFKINTLAAVSRRGGTLPLPLSAIPALSSTATAVAAAAAVAAATTTTTTVSKLLSTVRSTRLLPPLKPPSTPSVRPPTHNYLLYQ